MLKKYFLFCTSLVLIFCMAITVSAHPGKTDGNGGHTNRSTGEYHYHHGYSAHDHRDIDGDGDLDCPYKFDDKTNHNSSNNSGTGTNTTSQTKPKDTTTQKNKGNDKTYAYIAIGFVVAFFILVNCLAIHIDETDKSPREETPSIHSVLLSVLSTIIVFLLIFSVMCLFKRPVQLRAISFAEMIQVLFSSALLSGIVWVFVNGASSLLNMLLCSLIKVEVYGSSGCFQRLTVPLSYAFTVLLFILQ